MSPKVSIIIPTYNRADVITRALNSVLAQTETNYEVIIVDDASTDETKQIIESYLDPRIRYLRHDKNKYAAAARNTGMEKATGQYIAFLDSDDEWVPTKLHAQLQIMDSRDDSWGCIYSGARIYKKSKKKKSITKARKFENTKRR